MNFAIPTLQIRLLRHKKSCDQLWASHLVSGTESSRSSLMTPLYLHGTREARKRRCFFQDPWCSLLVAEARR